MSIQVDSLHIYPVKSCRGLTLSKFEIAGRGPRYDREWMIVDEVTQRFVTQREYPQLARVETALDDLSLTMIFHNSNNAINEKSSEPVKLVIPLTFGATLGELKIVRIWNDDAESIDQGDGCADVISEFLGKRNRLVRIAPNYRRLLPEKHGLPGAHVGFSDGMPLLVTSLESLKDLNSRLSIDDAAPMDRFRPNVVIRGAPEFEEDKWKCIRIGTIEFDITKPSARCVIINVDQTTGAKNPAVLKTLASYRTSPEKRVMFGQYLTHLEQGYLQVGDALEVLEYRK